MDHTELLERLARLGEEFIRDLATVLPPGEDWTVCGAHCRSTGQPCRRKPVPGKRRCRNHGGLSTGRTKTKGVMKPDGDEMTAKIIAMTKTGLREYEAKHGPVTPAPLSALRGPTPRRRSTLQSMCVMKRLLLERNDWDEEAETQRRLGLLSEEEPHP